MIFLWSKSFFFFNLHVYIFWGMQHTWSCPHGQMPALRHPLWACDSYRVQYGSWGMCAQPCRAGRSALVHKRTHWFKSELWGVVPQKLNTGRLPLHNDVLDLVLLRYMKLKTCCCRKKKKSTNVALFVSILIGFKWIWDHGRFTTDLWKVKVFSTSRMWGVSHLFFTSFLLDKKKKVIVAECVSVFLTLHLGITAGKHPWVSFFLFCLFSPAARPASRVPPPP